ncbi:hypothetical protein JCM1840_003349 [Sporobolomyces johnsonii]
MQRFRKKSESKKRAKGKEVDRRGNGSSDGGAAPTPAQDGTGRSMMRSPSGTLLPEASDFRTSLILPHLTKRFTLLRGEDGQLVDMVTMQNHLAAQRMTGRLTAYEVDAVLAQYRLQSAFESSEPPVPSLPSLPKRKRIDWSGIDLEGATDNMRTSIATTSEETTSSQASATPYLSPTIGTSSFPASPVGSSANSFVSFSSSMPPSASPTAVDASASSTASNSSPPSQPYIPRRAGGNSLFGGRVHTMREMKMSKSGSTASLASNAESLKSTSSSKRGMAQQDEDEGDEERSRRFSEDEPAQASEVNSDVRPSGEAPREEEEGVEELSRREPGEDEEADTEEAEDDDADQDMSTAPELPPLSNAQLKRISRALDNIEEELSKTYLKLASTTVEEDDEDEAKLDDLTRSTLESVNDSDLDGLDSLVVEVDEADAASPISPVNENDFNGVHTFNLPSPTDELPSPTISDTEPMDPFFARIALSSPVPVLPSLRDSITKPFLATSSVASPEESTVPLVPQPLAPTRAPPSPPIEQEPPASPPMPPVSPATNPAEIALPSSSSFGSSLSFLSREEATPTPLAIPASPRHSRDVSAETDETETPISAPQTPAAYSFPVVPRRDVESGSAIELLEVPGVNGDGDLTTVSDDGPFDLSLGEGQVRPGDGEIARTVEDAHGEGFAAFAATVPLPDVRDSVFSLESTGSSFHEAQETLDSDEDEVEIDEAVRGSTLLDVRDSALLDFPPPSAGSRRHSLPTLAASTPLDPVVADDLNSSQSSQLRPMSVPLDRRPSNELLAIASARSDGDTSDLVLEDLVLIQETLVRSAAKRAARRAAGAATSSSFDDSDAFSSPVVPRIEREVVDGSDSESVPGSRKDSIESTLTSTGAFDLGAELAGLGLTSLAPFDLNRAASSARRTSQTGSSPLTNTAVTPSTNQSDAFELSSLVGSPDTGSWEDTKERLLEEAPGSGDSEELSPEGGFSRSPAMQDLSGGDQDAGRDATVEPEATESAEPGPLLGAPVQLDAESFLRVPRNMPRRDPASTTSMLVRDVRNQATLATFALKKQGPTSPPTRSQSKGKSIRKGSISSPQLVSGPVAIPTVPILNPHVSSSPRPFKVSLSKTRKDKDADGEGSKSKGLGSRFRMLLKKQSRDHLPQLNGDEITPFVDFSAEEPSPAPADMPPVTPPNQDNSRFGPSTPDFPQTPDDPSTPSASAYTNPRSPPQCPLDIPVVEEIVERPSPSQSFASESAANSPYIGSPSSMGPPSISSTQGRSLTRLVSRLRGSGSTSGRLGSDLAPGARESLRSPTASPERPLSVTRSPRSPQPSLSGAEHRPSMEQEAVGLGLAVAETNSRAPISYDISSRRGRRTEDGPFPTIARTAPLSLVRNGQTNSVVDLRQSSYSFRPESAASVSRTDSRASGHASRMSIDSMKKLWEAAEDLGLPPDKVQELVDSAYAQSPSIASHARSGSTTSTVGKRSLSDGDQSRQRQSSVASLSGFAPYTNGHRRGLSTASTSSSRRGGSNTSHRSVQDRAPTPPPASRHRRQASAASSRQAGPIPEVPAAFASSSPPASTSVGSRLSVYGAALPAPTSPSLGSLSSNRSSGYAGSFIDYYADDADAGGSEHWGEPPTSGRRFSVDEQLGLALAQHEQDQETARLGAVYEHEHGGEGDDDTFQPSSSSAQTDPGETDGEIVWRVLDDLRNNRLSTISKDSSFGFNSSRDSSFEVEGVPEPDRTNAIAGLLRHRDRERERKRLSTSTSASLPPFQAGGRYPSVYVRDEKRLLALGQHGGVAPEQEGRFLVRPKEVEPEVPDLPEEWRAQTQQ